MKVRLSAACAPYCHLGLYCDFDADGNVRRKLFQPEHGPQTWPWWRLFSVRAYEANGCARKCGWMVWLYTRWGALPWHVGVDRRTPQQRGIA